LVLAGCSGQTQRACDVYKEAGGNAMPTMAEWTAVFSRPRELAEIQKKQAENQKRREQAAELNARMKRWGITGTDPAKMYPEETVESRAVLQVAYATGINARAVEVAAIRLNLSQREVLGLLENCDKSPSHPTKSP
jgi:hypothetical protein